MLLPIETLIARSLPQSAPRAVSLQAASLQASSMRHISPNVSPAKIEDESSSPFASVRWPTPGARLRVEWSRYLRNRPFLVYGQQAHSLLQAVYRDEVNVNPKSTVSYLSAEEFSHIDLSKRSARDKLISKYEKAPILLIALHQNKSESFTDMNHGAAIVNWLVHYRSQRGLRTVVSASEKSVFSLFGIAHWFQDRSTLYMPGLDADSVSMRKPSVRSQSGRNRCRSVHSSRNLSVLH